VKAEKAELTELLPRPDLALAAKIGCRGGTDAIPSRLVITTKREDIGKGISCGYGCSMGAVWVGVGIVSDK